MKILRSTRTLAFALMLSLTANIFAQGAKAEKAQIEQITINSIYGMNSEYSSIVESTLFVVLQVKERYPDEDYDKLIDRLNDLAVEGNTPSIRYKAQLASLYFNYYDLFNDIKITDKENPDKYFKLISEKLSSKSTLAAN